jgi:phage tail tube protein FII
MAAGLIIPELLNHYNVYNDAQKLIGISGDVELPDFEAITETIEGAGGKQCCGRRQDSFLP